MSSNFDWQTEDENRRNQSNWDSPPEPPAPKTRRWAVNWRLASVLIVLAGITALLVWWRVDQQVDANLQAIRNDVASSYNLLQRAAADQDEELFRSVLSGRDPVWTTSQLELFAGGLLTDRRPLGLRATEGSLPLTLPVPVEEAAADETVAEITFAPDLSEATVIAWHPYVYEDGEGQSTIVLLEQTSIFRRGGQRWLFSPPADDFWGARESTEVDRLTLFYPERDRALALRLASDLDDIVGRVCTLQGITCDETFHLTIELDTEPGVLVDLGDATKRYAQSTSGATDLTLPTPTLAGLPLRDDEDQEFDAEGYAALLRGYAVPTAQVALASLSGWSCCDQQTLFEALTDYQLAQLGLRHWPLGREEWDQVVEERVALSDIRGIWRTSDTVEAMDEERWPVYAVVEFLLEAFAPRTAADFQRHLPVSPNLEEWLQRLATDDDAARDALWVLESLDEAWWIYALQGDIGDEATSWPDTGEDLIVACVPIDGTDLPGTSTAYRFEPDTGRWEQLYEVDGFFWMNPLPAPGTLLTQEFLIEEERWQSSVWREGDRMSLVNEREEYNFSFAESDPDGRYLVSYRWNSEESVQQAVLVDLETCSNGDCQETNLPGLPIWSPDGQHVILTGNGRSFPDSSITTNERVALFDTSDRLSEEALHLTGGAAITDEAELIDIGRGYAPFWIDERTYGFVDVLYDEELSSTLEQQVVIATIDDPTPQPLLNSIDMRAPLPIEATPSNLTIAYAISDPLNANVIYVVGLHEHSRVAYVFRYDMERGETSLVLESDYELNQSLGFSPDGRHLVMTGRDPVSAHSNESNGLLYLYNPQTEETIPFQMPVPFFLTVTTYDWTSDGRWLALAMEDGLLALIAVDEMSIRTVPHDLGICTSVIWLEQTGEG